MTTFAFTYWVLAGVLGAFWMLCALSNLISSVGAARRRGTTSLILFFGGVAGAVALLICPIPGLWVWCWVPALLDIGTLPALAAMIYGSLTKSKQGQ